MPKLFKSIWSSITSYYFSWYFKNVGIRSRSWNGGIPLFIYFVLLFIRHLIFVFLLFSDSKFEGCQSSSRVFDQASRLQSWMGGHLLQLCTFSSHVLTNPELFCNCFLRKARLKMNSVPNTESMALRKLLWGICNVLTVH